MTTMNDPYKAYLLKETLQHHAQIAVMNGIIAAAGGTMSLKDFARICFYKDFQNDNLTGIDEKNKGEVLDFFDQPIISAVELGVTDLSSHPALNYHFTFETIGSFQTYGLKAKSFTEIMEGAQRANLPYLPSSTPRKAFAAMALEGAKEAFEAYLGLEIDTTSVQNLNELIIIALQTIGYSLDDAAEQKEALYAQYIGGAVKSEASWMCSTAPEKICYYAIDDRTQDSCIFCGSPRE